MPLAAMSIIFAQRIAFSANNGASITMELWLSWVILVSNATIDVGNGQSGQVDTWITLLTASSSI
jgi:hypothetical protein